MVNMIQLFYYDMNYNYFNVNFFLEKSNKKRFEADNLDPINKTR